MRCRIIALGVLFALACPAGHAVAAQPCGGDGPVQGATISGAAANGMVQLQTANGPASVRLAALAPFPGPDGLAAYAAALGQTAGAEAAFSGTGAAPDRDGALPGSLGIPAFGTSVEAGVLAEGAAFISPQAAPACRDSLLASEAQARDTSRGGWGAHGWPLAADDPALVALAPDFAVVWGQVHDIGVRPRRTYLNLGNDWSASLTVSLTDSVRDALGGADAVARLKGEYIEVRGYITLRRGPLAELAGAGAIRILRIAEKSAFQLRAKQVKHGTKPDSPE